MWCSESRNVFASPCFLLASSYCQPNMIVYVATLANFLFSAMDTIFFSKPWIWLASSSSLFSDMFLRTYNRSFATPNRSPTRLVSLFY